MPSGRHRSSIWLESGWFRPVLRPNYWYRKQSSTGSKASVIRRSRILLEIVAHVIGQLALPVALRLIVFLGEPRIRDDCLRNKTQPIRASFSVSEVKMIASPDGAVKLSLCVGRRVAG